MDIGTTGVRRCLRGFAGLTLGGVFFLGFLESCSDQLITLTEYVEPCGTFLGNCDPGSFTVSRAEVGDYCVDPACSVPGACSDDQPLGTITDVCP